MAKRQKEWARTARRHLLTQLGGKCSTCGATDNLEFDCVRPMGDRHHRGSTDERMSFYNRMARANNLQVLCARCNSLKGDLDQASWLALVRTAVHEQARAEAREALPVAAGPDRPGEPF